MQVRLTVHRFTLLSVIAELNRFNLPSYSLHATGISYWYVKFTAPNGWEELYKMINNFGNSVTVCLSEDDKPHPSDNVKFKNTAVRETAEQIWEYNCLELLTAASVMLHSVPVVSEDYVTRRMRYENAISDFIRAMKNNGRLT